MSFMSNTIAIAAAAEQQNIIIPRIKMKVFGYFAVTLSILFMFELKTAIATINIDNKTRFVIGEKS